MATHVLPVSGLFERGEDGERAASVLREKGFEKIAMRPLKEVNLQLLPMTEEEMKAKMYRTLFAAPIGFVALGSVGLVVGSTIKFQLGLGAGLLLGMLGALIAIAWMDRPAERYRRYMNEGGVLLTVECAEEEETKTVELLRSTGAVEVEKTVHAV
ncbi:MAG: hypothetical protein JNL62_19750 [Bryobacterales bacterium]|nr:hypothetical protein [Bryobacterales bacterium]